MLVSICIPCYYSSATIATVVKGIKEEFSKHPGYSYQILLANDGSTDDTFEVIRSLAAEDENICGINLSRNFGQGQALCALYRYIEGDMAVFMDDDGQHPAAGIFKLLEKIEEGYDFAIADFGHKMHSGFKVVTSKLHRFTAELCGTCPKDITYSSFTAMSRTAIEAVKLYDSPYPSVGAYLMNVTSRFVNVPMEHKDRLAGQSGYSLKKLLMLTADSLTSFSLMPLRFAALLGGLFCLIGFLLGVVSVVMAILGVYAGISAIISVVLICSGLLMILLGLCGEYLGRIYMILNKKPQFFIRESVNLHAGTGQKTDCISTLI